MPDRSSTQTKLTPADRFRPIIEAAIAAGVDLSEQVLQLTHGDSARLRRDPTVRDDEISFKTGSMEFIGVRVIEGASASGLADASGTVIAPAPSEGGALSAAKGQKKSNKEVRKPKAEKAKPAPAAGRDFTTPPGKAR
jgi:hypothetical protein